MATGEGQRQGRISLLTEVVGYLGAILLLAGGVAAVSRQWDHFGAWGHVGTFTGAAAFFLLAGFSCEGAGTRDPAADQRDVAAVRGVHGRGRRY